MHTLVDVKECVKKFTFNARARFSSRLRCSSSILRCFLSRACGRGDAPVPCGSVYVWLWLTMSWTPRLCRAKSSEQEYFISGWLTCDDDDDKCLLMTGPTAPSRLCGIVWCIPYGSYSYLMGISDCRGSTPMPLAADCGKAGWLVCSWK